MESIEVQITKIKVSKEKKTGEKLAAIELTRRISETDEYDGAVAKAINQMAENDGAVAKAINQMAENDGIEIVRLSTIEAPMMLTFSNPGAKAAELVKECALEKFKLKREPSKSGDIMTLAFEFTIGLTQAKRWLIPAIGDVVSVLIEKVQGDLPLGPRAVDAEARPN